MLMDLVAQMLKMVAAAPAVMMIPTETVSRIQAILVLMSHQMLKTMQIMTAVQTMMAVVTAVITAAVTVAVMTLMATV